jgi:serine/threonine protein kinase
MTATKLSKSKQVSRKRGRKGRPDDESTGYARVFISYSHSDTPWMERFRRELNAALFKKATVWCDKDIDRGTDWENRLDVELDRADVALVLATTEYLQSSWCRKELEYVCSKFKEKRIRHLFWVEIKPCAWKQTELATFQRSGSAGPDSSLAEIQDENERSREIVRIVEEICVGVEESVSKQDSDLLTVKGILGDEAFKRHISVESVISTEGDFAIVCRGRDGSHRDVAIKVMRRSPITGIFDNLKNAAKRRQDLRDPGFIRLYESFVVKSPYGDHLVLVMEYFEGGTLREALQDKSLRDRFDVDRTVTLVRRAAEALCELHDVEYGKGRKRGEIAGIGFGPMIPEHVFYDRRLDRLRFPALSISNFVWDVLGWKKFAALVDNACEQYAAPEQIVIQRNVTRIDKSRIDQYMLGQLTAEMLDGKLPLGGPPAKDDLSRKEASFDEPLRYAGRWKNAHPQLAHVIARMLSRTPDERWGSMKEVVAALKAVEDNQRALAKASYMKWIDTDTRFFEEFYKRFFASRIAKEKNSEGRFTDRKQQYDKLRMGMAAVLNFYPGNEPTSMRYVSELHRTKGVTEDELVQFKVTFLQLLKDWIPKRQAHTDAMADHKEIIDAWSKLFEEVLQYFREQEGKA